MSDHAMLWARVVDRQVESAASRWHSTHEGGARTTDRIGDSLVTRLWYLTRFLDSNDCEQLLQFVMAAFVAPLHNYKQETRALVKLAYTGHVLQRVKRFHRWLDWFSAALYIPEADNLIREWRPQLQHERDDRVRFFQTRLSDDALFDAQFQREAKELDGVGDADEEHQYSLELLTLLMHDHETNRELLHPSEQATVSLTYKRLSQRSSLVVFSVPRWFMSPLEVGGADNGMLCRGAMVSIDHLSGDESEEAFVHQVAQWSGFNHPHVAKLFGACHVGKRLYVYEWANRFRQDMMVGKDLFWSWVYQSAMGLHYLHERGMACPSFSEMNVLVVPYAGKAMLHGAGVVALSLHLQRSDSSTQPSSSSLMSTEGSDDNRKRSGSLMNTKVLPFVASDLLSLAKLVLGWIQNRRYVPRDRWIDLDSTQALGKLERPEFLSAQEWSLLAGMCPNEAKEHSTMASVIQQLQALAVPTHGKDGGWASLPPDQQVSDVIDPSLGISLDGIFNRFRDYFSVGDPEQELDLHVFQRLSAIYKQILDQPCGSLSAELLVRFSSIVSRFFRSTVLRNDRSTSAFSEFSASIAVRTIAGRNYTYHHEIDRLLAFPNVNADDPIQQWARR